MFVIIWIILSVGLFCNKIMFGLTSLISLHPFPWESHDLLFSYTEPHPTSYRSVIFRPRPRYIFRLHFTLSFSSHSRRFLHLTSSDTSQWELSPDLLLDFSSELSVRPLLRPLIRPLSQTSQWDLSSSSILVPAPVSSPLPVEANVPSTHASRCASSRGP